MIFTVLVKMITCGLSSVAVGVVVVNVIKTLQSIVSKRFKTLRIDLLSLPLKNKQRSSMKQCKAVAAVQWYLLSCEILYMEYALERRLQMEKNKTKSVPPAALKICIHLHILSSTALTTCSIIPIPPHQHLSTANTVTVPVLRQWHYIAMSQR
jgi:hypothetical protein